MKTIQRYDPNFAEYQEWDDGMFVLYDDYFQKVQELKTLLSHVRLGTGDIFCDDVNDKNWFDERDRLINNE